MSEVEGELLVAWLAWGIGIVAVLSVFAALAAQFRRMLDGR